MTELETRLMATGIVERLRAKGHQPFQIRVRPNGSGVTAHVGFLNGLKIEANVPPGFFSYDRIAEDLCHQIQAATMESD